MKYIYRVIAVALLLPIFLIAVIFCLASESIDATLDKLERMNNQNGT